MHAHRGFSLEYMPVVFYLQHGWLRLKGPSTFVIYDLVVLSEETV